MTSLVRSVHVNSSGCLSLLSDHNFIIIPVIAFLATGKMQRFPVCFSSQPRVLVKLREEGRDNQTR